MPTRVKCVFGDVFTCVPPTVIIDLGIAATYRGTTRRKRRSNGDPPVRDSGSTEVQQQPPQAQGQAVSAQAPMLLGRYRLMQNCGTGGFGSVLACWDTRLQRRVAIKCMPLGPSDPSTPGAGQDQGMSSTLGEALKEARTSSLLAHPNIVTVYDFEADDRMAYLVMEYVDGITLSELLGRVEGGRLTGDECAYLIDQVAKALSFAHANGVLHLDIKPTNIMIDHDGVVKICDFGMATLASAVGYGDARGGTVGYMPPEQIVGGFVDERSDVFSLAVVVTQAYLGRNPFVATTADESLAKIEARAADEQIQALEIGDVARDALVRALDPDQSQRIWSMEELAGDVVVGSGDVRAGGESIYHLITQAEEDQPREDINEVVERLPITFRFPWATSACARMLAAATSAYLAHLLLPFALPASLAGQEYVLGGTALVGALAALWPPLGSLAVGALVSWAPLATDFGAASLGCATVCAVVAFGWWVLVGVGDRFATGAVLVAPCLGAPGASVAVAADALTPGKALLTAIASWLFSAVIVQLASASFVVSDASESLVGLMTSAQTWIELLGCALGAAVGSAVAHHDVRPTNSVLGQVIACVFVLAFSLGAIWVQNQGAWAYPTWEEAGVAVLLCVLVSAVAVLRGPREPSWEVDETI